MVIGDYTVDQVIEKAQTLIEAMPYIKKFQGKTVVVKYGGSAMLDENLKYNVIKDVAMLKLVGMKPVIVHGGGKEISKWVEKVGKEAEFINGLRVTDAETMEIAEMVLGKVNKSLVSLMQKIGLKAVGISGKDGGMFTVKKKFPGGKDIGYVGEITNVDTSILTSLIEDDFIPVSNTVWMRRMRSAAPLYPCPIICSLQKSLRSVSAMAFSTWSCILTTRISLAALLSPIYWRISLPPTRRAAICSPP